MMAVCLADPDHPASYDHILGPLFETRPIGLGAPGLGRVST